MELRITLAGTVSIGGGGGSGHQRVDGTELGPRGRTALAYLVLERDRLVPRDELADAVWGEGVPPTWRAALRGVLGRVRTTLASGVSPELVLACDQGCYQLRLPPPVEVDVERASADLASARFALERGDPEMAHERAARAVAIARRGFLPGTTGQWVERRQAELRELRVEGLEIVSDAGAALGRAADALHAAEEALAIQPLRESAHVRVMTAHARAGNDGEALRAYERCRQVLVEELGAFPSATTEATYLSLLGTSSSGSRSARHRRAGNLSSSLTTLVGREGQVEGLIRLQAATRVLTLSGTGGVGKSRVASELASRIQGDHPDGVWLVELAGVSDERLVAHQVRSALGFPDHSEHDAIGSLAAHLAERQLLLVFDNCEHLVAAVADLVQRVLAVCPGVRVLVTSREPLGVAGEVVWPVPPLPIPATAAAAGATDGNLDELLGYAAVRLFAERAATAAPGIDLAPVASGVAEICRRLDGLPLAIELAAARVQALGVNEIAERLDDRFRLLSSGPRWRPARHQSLRAALDWSYEASPPVEQRVLCALSVFASGFDLEAAEAVCAGPGAGIDIVGALSGLVARSLVVVERPAGSVRYRLLETVREYAADQVGTEGALAEVRDRHLTWARSLVSVAAGELDGPQQGRWLEILDAEHDNLRAALDWAATGAGAIDGAHLAAALSRFWEVRGHLSEGRARIAAHLSAASTPSLRASLHTAAGILAQRQSDRTSARHHYRTSLALRRRLGDRLGAVSARHGLGNLAVGEGDLSSARTCFEENLRIGRQLEDVRVTAAALVNLGVVVQFLVEGGQVDRVQGVSQAREHYEEALTLYRDLGDRHGIALSLENLGVLAPFGGDVARSRRLLQESLDIRRELGDQVGIAAATRFLSQLALSEGDHPTARGLQEQSLGIERVLGNDTLVAADLASLARIVGEEGDGARADRLLRESADLTRKLATAPAFS